MRYIIDLLKTEVFQATSSSLTGIWQAQKLLGLNGPVYDHIASRVCIAAAKRKVFGYVVDI